MNKSNTQILRQKITWDKNKIINKLKINNQTFLKKVRIYFHFDNNKMKKAIYLIFLDKSFQWMMKLMNKKFHIIMIMVLTYHNQKSKVF